MIQRVQSIYLLLAFTCTVLLLIFPLFSITAVHNAVDNDAVVAAEFGAYGLVFTNEISSMVEMSAQYQAFGGLADNPQSGRFPVYLMYIGMAMLTLMAFFFYKNRKRQLMISRLTFILYLLVTAGVYAFYYVGLRIIKTELPVTADLTINFGLGAGFFLLLAALPFLWLAIRGIKNDENLVKSLERLR